MKFSIHLSWICSLSPLGEKFEFLKFLSSKCQRLKHEKKKLRFKKHKKNFSGLGNFFRNDYFFNFVIDTNSASN